MSDSTSEKYNLSTVMWGSVKWNTQMEKWHPLSPWIPYWLVGREGSEMFDTNLFGEMNLARQIALGSLNQQHDNMGDKGDDVYSARMPKIQGKQLDKRFPTDAVPIWF